ncbi:hypothetical protein VSH64_09390 [Amycolatopsis rhabdoformis]|uniref:Uncharacterized protein n=1 Tax=Amycolatopsis rhabdoformis TaxID=1448059 RepID=A0ABZ1IMS6_9PSEU|nr:hypothetical protein [Amycolatopsis rhabdoformis]WSE35435.1 hypothetical protein VSH64_09390 [Amycolatopsis rhabdoformis]
MKVSTSARSISKTLASAGKSSRSASVQAGAEKHDLRCRGRSHRIVEHPRAQTAVGAEAAPHRARVAGVDVLDASGHRDTSAHTPDEVLGVLVPDEPVRTVGFDRPGGGDHQGGGADALSQFGIAHRGRRYRRGLPFPGRIVVIITKISNYRQGGE